MGEEASIYYHLSAGDSTAELEYSSSKSQIVNNTKKKFSGGGWQTYNNEKNAYVADSVRSALKFIYTGEKKHN